MTHTMGKVWPGALDSGRWWAWQFLAVILFNVIDASSTCCLDPFSYIKLNSVGDMLLSGGNILSVITPNIGKQNPRLCQELRPLWKQGYWYGLIGGHSMWLDGLVEGRLSSAVTKWFTIFSRCLPENCLVVCESIFYCGCLWNTLSNVSVTIRGIT